MDQASTRYPNVVIVGGGFGGIEATKALARASVQVTLVDRQNHHCFQPLLYQVATAALSPADVAWPIRHILRRQKNATVIMAEVTVVDTAAQLVHTDSVTIPYDFLVIATGAMHSYSATTNGPGSRLASKASRTPPRSGAGSYSRSSAPNWWMTRIAGSSFSPSLLSEVAQPGWKWQVRWPKWRDRP